MMNRFPALRISAAALALAALVSTAACGGDAEANPPPPPPPTQYVVAVDLSTSLTETERARHQALLRALVKELDYGDRLVLMKAHAAGIRDTSTARTIAMPVPRGAHPLQREKDELDLARQTADLYVTSLFKTAPVNGSDLFATLHSAGERAREGTGARKVLVVLSDMLQCAGEVCMERAGRLPDSAWIAARQAEGLVFGLDDVCVSVVGADASTTRGVNVREFWRRYFHTAGADFNAARYVHSASGPGILRCE